MPHEGKALSGTTLGCEAKVWQNEAKIINVFNGHAGQLRGA
jgi:hypothetical protein